jgi:hypothetical protein
VVLQTTLPAFQPPHWTAAPAPRLKNTRNSRGNASGRGWVRAVSHFYVAHPGQTYFANSCWIRHETRPRFDAVEHDPENVGNKPFEVIGIELKS